MTRPASDQSTQNLGVDMFMTTPSSVNGRPASTGCLASGSQIDEPPRAGLRVQVDRGPKQSLPIDGRGQLNQSCGHSGNCPRKSQKGRVIGRVRKMEGCCSRGISMHKAWRHRETDIIMKL